MFDATMTLDCGLFQSSAQYHLVCGECDLGKELREKQLQYQKSQNIFFTKYLSLLMAIIFS